MEWCHRFKLQLELVSLAERNGAPIATLPAVAAGEARAVGGRPALLRRRRRSREHLKEGLGRDVGLAHAAHGGDFLGVGHQNGRGSFDARAQPRVVRTEDLAALVRITCVARRSCSSVLSNEAGQSGNSIRSS